jgi:hypothetical protein
LAHSGFSVPPSSVFLWPDGTVAVPAGVFFMRGFR